MDRWTTVNSSQAALERGASRAVFRDELGGSQWAAPRVESFWRTNIRLVFMGPALAAPQSGDRGPRDALVGRKLSHYQSCRPGIRRHGEVYLAPDPRWAGGGAEVLPVDLASDAYGCERSLGRPVGVGAEPSERGHDLRLCRDRWRPFHPPLEHVDGETRDEIAGRPLSPASSISALRRRCAGRRARPEASPPRHQARQLELTPLCPGEGVASGGEDDGRGPRVLTKRASTEHRPRCVVIGRCRHDPGAGVGFARWFISQRSLQPGWRCTEARFASVCGLTPLITMDRILHASRNRGSHNGDLFRTEKKSRFSVLDKDVSDCISARDPLEDLQD